MESVIHTLQPLNHRRHSIFGSDYNLVILADLIMALNVNDSTIIMVKCIMSISKAMYTQYLPVSQSKRPPICITLHFSKLNACQYNRIVTSQILRYQYNMYDREYIDVRIYIHSNLLE